jgi:hypothetical protein
MAQNTTTTPADGARQSAAEIFDDTTAAAYVGGIKPRAIRDWRTRRGLPFIRITAKVCRIRRTDLDRWLGQHRVALTKGVSQ